MAESIGSVFSLSGLFGLLATLCLIGAIIAAGVLIFQTVKQRREQNAVGGGVEKSENNVQMTGLRDQQKHQRLQEDN